MIITYTPECADCGVPSDDVRRYTDGHSLCRDCCPAEEWLYEVVYADPPWAERGAGKIKRGADRHYPLMHTDDIALLGHHLPNGEPGVSELAAPDSFLFLWATNNHLPDALFVMESWGYVYKTNWAWVKDKQGLGFYNRGQHELLLLGVRGKPARSQRGEGLEGMEISPSAVHAPRTKHSEKPDAFRRIAESFGRPRLEMFARTLGSRPIGWDVWGNEA